MLKKSIDYFEFKFKTMQIRQGIKDEKLLFLKKKKCSILFKEKHVSFSEFSNIFLKIKILH